MAQAFTPGLTVSPRHTLRRRRELPIAGDILVKVGDSVSREQIVARAYLEGELRLVRVAEELGITPKEIHAALRVSVGASVIEGEVVAEVRGLWGLLRTTVSSPITGTLEFISDSTGHIGIRAAPRKLELSAYLTGRVVGIEGQRAVVIESEASFVQGIFGVGGERIGRVRLLDMQPNMVVTEEDVPASVAGAILIGGHSPTIQALHKACAAGAVGFVTGSINDRVLSEYVGRDIGVAVTGDENIPMTLIVTEGFGALPMGERVWEIMGAIRGQFASLNGATQVRAGAVRPEIVSEVPNDVTTSQVVSSLGGGGLRQGSRVRLIRIPFFGQVGTVEELPQDLQQIETGAWTRVLKARLDDGRVVIVPRANVELF